MKHDVVIASHHLIEIITPIFIAVNFNTFLAGFGSLLVALYYLGRIKFEQVDAKFNGSWKEYLKSLFNLHTKK